MPLFSIIIIFLSFFWRKIKQFVSNIKQTQHNVSMYSGPSSFAVFGFIKQTKLEWVLLLRTYMVRICKYLNIYIKLLNYANPSAKYDFKYLFCLCLAVFQFILPRIENNKNNSLTKNYIRWSEFQLTCKHIIIDII
jgi:hypothetical protein